MISKLKITLVSLILFFAGRKASAQLPPPTIIDLDRIRGWLVTISNWLLGVGVILAIIVVVWSGIRWMTASDPKSARQMLTSGVIGVAIILGVGLIIKTVASLVMGDFFN